MLEQNVETNTQHLPFPDVSITRNDDTTHMKTLHYYGDTRC